jgi:hypothetical protein
MKKGILVLGILSVIGFCSQAWALTPALDGILYEWTGPEVLNLGTQTASGGGSYTLLATWDATNLYIGVDRNSTDRYLGDTYLVHDSFFVAIDVDGLAGSGGLSDGYSTVDFNGARRPDFVYNYAGGEGWYESCSWNGSGYNWLGWSNAGTFYGWSESNPNDEITIPLSAIGGSHNVMIWAWMTIEGVYNSTTASWPAGSTGTSPTFGEGVLIERLDLPHTPDPAVSAVNVLVDSTLSWAVPQDPNGVVDPNLVSMKLYMATAGDPNLLFVSNITSWNPTTKRASYTPSSPLSYDMTYRWRVDSIHNDAEVLTGTVWTFASQKSIPAITGNPSYQVVSAGGTANFTVTVYSPSTPTYQWYKYVDGVSDTKLTNSGDISGVTTVTLSIANVDLTDEGGYYCIVNNASGTPVLSNKALLGIKRRIAYWPFEGGNPNSTVAGSPASVLYGSPIFDAGIVGNGMSFSNGSTQDLLYTDPTLASYFDICNFSMTISCWIKSTSPAWWGSFVARNGEDNGWQVRQRIDTRRVCLTTRGTGNDEGTGSNRTAYDGTWHQVVATFNGTVKKVYIDGIVSRFYSTDNGSVINDGDAVTGLINSSESPVSLAGRVRGGVSTLAFESFTPCTLDEVEIYNYALDAATIAQTYANITDTVVCSGIQAYDLDGNCVVNLNDFVLLASQWLSDIRVQPTP